jgi:membrane fusion protein, multidrug efflux system
MSHDVNDASPADGASPPVAAGTPSRAVPRILFGAVALIAVSMITLVYHARRGTNQVALASMPKAVTAVRAIATTYRPQVRLIGTVEPWQSARISPQLVSAFVSSVVVRPGDRVRRGDVLATLNCKNANFAIQSAAGQAKALEERARALAQETARFEEMGQGGFVSPNELDQRRAQIATTQAQLEAQRGQLGKSSLEVSDCVLRAPFDGEVAERLVDPGAFVRPGTTLLSVIDRRLLRITGDAPETSLAATAPEVPVKVHLLATARDLSAKISRRAPAADPITRTIHFEIDLDAKDLALPTGTTADLTIEVGEPQPAIVIPLVAASVRGTKASVFVADGESVKKRSVKVLGERDGKLFVAPDLKEGSAVVTEGRATIADGDKVLAKVVAPDDERAAR